MSGVVVRICRTSGSNGVNGVNAVGTAGRSYFGGRSEASTRSTVDLPIHRSRATRRCGTPSATSRRIKAQSSTEITHPICLGGHVFARRYGLDFTRRRHQPSPIAMCYGRQLRYVERAGRDLVQSLLRSGAVRTRPSTPPPARLKAYRLDETAAKDNNEEVWGVDRTQTRPGGKSR